MDLADSDPRDEQQDRRHAADEIIVSALAVGHSYSEAADLANVSPRTVRRRMADPAFAAEVSRRRGERVSALTGQVVEHLSTALRVVVGSLDSPSDSVALRAADLLWQWSVRLRHSNELEERIKTLEDERDEPRTEGEDPYEP